MVLSVQSADLGISGVSSVFGDDYEGGSIGGQLPNLGMNIPRGLSIPGLTGDF